MAPREDKMNKQQSIVVVTDFAVDHTEDRISELAGPKQIVKQLPPTDTGRVAYQTLVACFFIESAAFGLSLAYGVFQEYYTTTFEDHQKASWIGVLSGGLSFLGAPLLTYCCQRFVLPRQYYLWLGFILCMISLLSSAFLTGLPGLIIMQGFVYGVGVTLIDIPLLIVLNTHFNKRRGLAYGIIFAGADVFGLGYTFLITFLLSRYSFKTTMLILASTVFIFTAPPLVILKERQQYSTIYIWGSRSPPALCDASTVRDLKIKSSTTVSSIDLPFSPSLQRRETWPIVRPRKRYYQRSVFYAYNFGNVLHACAFYLPLIYLPTFVSQAGHSKHSAAIVLAVANVAQAVGEISFGKLSDICSVNFLIIVSMSMSSVSSFVLWGVFGSGPNGLAVLIAYAFLFGTFGSGILALWARMGTVFGERDSQMVYSTLAFGRGIGCIASGPISQALISAHTPLPLRVLGGEQFGSVVMFVGTCLAFGGLMGVFAIFALWWKKDSTHVSVEEQGIREKDLEL